METKTFCSIMNHIRNITTKQGDKPEDIVVHFTLVNGTIIPALLSDYEFMDDFLEILSQNETYYYVPIKNIVAINV